jgi:peptide/nickel transport system permease protein
MSIDQVPAGEEPGVREVGVMPLPGRTGFGWRTLPVGRLGSITGKVCAGYLVVLVVVAACLPILPIDPTAQNLSRRLLAPGFGHGFAFILGADSLGRSELARLIDGARLSLLVGVSSAVLAMVIGTVLGIMAGVLRGAFETVVMRVTDLWMGLPVLLVALTALYVLGGGALNLILVLGLMRWVVFARLARALTLSIRESQYYECAVAIGCSTTRIMRVHVFRNIMWSILSLASLETVRSILSEASLSFLGLGIQAPQSSWGSMLSDAQDYMSSAPWLVLLPGLAILLTTLAINLVIGAVRDTDQSDVSVWKNA